MDKIIEILSNYFDNEIINTGENKIGHINSTYAVELDNSEKYILQKINKFVFRHPKDVMHNIILCTDHIRAGLKFAGVDPTRRVLNVIKTKTGQYFHIDEAGDYWRVYDFIDNAKTYSECDDPKLFEKIGFAFGQFQEQLSDFDVSKLKETIPDFHNTPKRVLDFRNSLALDKLRRTENALEEIAFIDQNEHLSSYITDKLDNGAIPLRVTHNDTKINNIMIDNASGEPICVIDLDTIMPGSELYDFGDAIRTGATTAAEDEADLSKVNFRLDMYEAYVKGTMKALGDCIVVQEIEGLPYGAFLMTFECGVRFLADYLDGDIYFKTAYETHNLVRAKNQFKLCEDMKKVFDLK